MSQQSLFHQSSTFSVSSAWNCWEESPLLPLLNQQMSPLVQTWWAVSLQLAVVGSSRVPLFPPSLWPPPSPRSSQRLGSWWGPVSSAVDGPEAELNSSKHFSDHDCAKPGKAYPFLFLWSSALSYVLWDITSHKSYSQGFEVSPYDNCIYPCQRAMNPRCCLMSWLNI